MADAPIVIVGAGQAGAVAAATLRRLGHAGRIVLVGDEAHAPYERPPLSKAVLADPAQDELGRVHPEASYAEQSIELHRGRPVAAIDTAAQQLRFADGETLPYGACLIATGGRARPLAALPPGAPGVHYLRTLDDARGLRAALNAADAALVIGGGFLGLEAASTARTMGREVTLIEGAPRLLERAVPQVFSDWLARRAEAAGVSLRLNARIAEAGATANGVTVSLQSGERLVAPMALVAIGMSPEVALAAAAGIALHGASGGIEVDALGRTSAPHVYAAGDCTSQYRAPFGQVMRIESWQNANEQARIAATAMLGQQPAEAALPWFWTDQFGVNIQMQGAYDPALAYSLRGDDAVTLETPKFLLLGMREGRLCHAIAVNAGGDLRPLRPLIEQARAVDLAALLDPAQPLRQTVKNALAAALAPAS